MLKPQRKAIQITSSYPILGQLSEDEVATIKEHRIHPGLGTLSDEEFTLILKLRGGLLRKDGTPMPIGALQEQILRELKRYALNHYELLNEVSKAFVFTEEIYSEALKNLQNEKKIEMRKPIGDEMFGRWKIISDT